MSEKPSDPAEQFRLVFLREDGGELSYVLARVPLKIGRSPDCQICLDESSLSKEHAELRKSAAGRYEVLDLNSSNGTFVNGEKIQRALLFGDEELEFGTVRARLTRSGPPELPDAERALDEVRQEMQMAQTELDLMRESLAAEKERLDEIEVFEATRAQVETDLRDQVGRLEQAKVEYNRLLAELQGLMPVRDQMLEKRQELEGIQAEHARLEEESREYREILDQFHERRSDLEDKLRRLEREVAKKEGELDFFQDRIEQARREREALLEEVRASRSMLSGIQGQEPKGEEAQM